MSTCTSYVLCGWAKLKWNVILKTDFSVWALEVEEALGNDNFLLEAQNLAIMCEIT